MAVRVPDTTEILGDSATESQVHLFWDTHENLFDSRQVSFV